MDNNFIGTVTYSKNGYGQVFVTISVSNEAAIGAGKTIFTLPAGYRPSRYVVFACKQSVTGANIFIGISTGGLIYISSSADAANFTINTVMSGQVSFRAL